jgi:pyruvate dehydrogenase (quinone)
MGQSLRRRHDRADWLLVRLLRHARLRRLAHARDRLQFYPEGAGVRIAQVDIRAENIGRRVALDLGVVGDIRSTLAALATLVDEKRDVAHLAQAQRHCAKARNALDDLAVGTPGKRLIHPQQVAKAISDHASEDAVSTPEQ